MNGVLQIRKPRGGKWVIGREYCTPDGGISGHNDLAPFWLVPLLWLLDKVTP